jgi:uncharacterized protein YfaS (alpha-2-macroglobulin family)
VRVFPAPVYHGEYMGPRTDFRETIHWAPQVRTGADGKATVRFFLSDAVTSFRVFSEGVGGGLAGRDETVLRSSLPFSMAVKLPLEVSAGDKLLLPLTVTNDREKPMEVAVNAGFGELLRMREPLSHRKLAIGAGKRESVFYPIDVTGKDGRSLVTFAASAGTLKDEFHREVQVQPLGFPQTEARSGEVKERAAHDFDLGLAVEGSVKASIRLYPSPVATMVQGMEGMMREPNGCFEQASSSNYPNVMVMQYLQQHNVAAVSLLERSRGLLERGYRRLAGYESKSKGYEWFGGSPAHEALTAYGLVQFVDMKGVHGEVDGEMIGRTAAWLKGRRDGKGGYQRDAKALDSFGRASPEVTDAYITYGLTEAGHTDIEKEIEAQAKVAAETRDAYLLALSANTLLNTPARKAAGIAAAKRLAKMQSADGVWTNADHSITRSSGVNLHIETTALAVLALLKAAIDEGAVRKAVEWLNANRGGYGQWGATQATVLALKAMTHYASASRKTRGPGSVTIFVNGKPVGEMGYEGGRRDALVFEELGAHFRSGKNQVEIAHTGATPLPYSIAIEYRSVKPASSAQAVVDLSTSIERASVKMGENVRVRALVRNKTDRGQPMALARVGLPGGLTFQTWQLKELREKGLIAFYETRAREVILYFRDLKPNEKKEIPLDLVATVPGEYIGPASSAYLYYTNDQKVWTDGLAVKITP